MRNFRNGMKLVAVNCLRDNSEKDEDGWRFPKEMDVEDFREHLVHKGRRSSVWTRHITVRFQFPHLAG